MAMGGFLADLIFSEAGKNNGLARSIKQVVSNHRKYINN